MFSFLSRSNGIDISAEEFKEKLEEERGVVIDVRSKMEYSQGHLKTSDQQIDFNAGEFHDKVDSLDKDKTYYLYCRSGNRSGQAARLMKSKGFENVFNIGGFDALANSGLETEK
ncbi:rhodanese-like domain-containing protein [Rhodohalobacter sp.]|uniref:rhodanese-like domain-containing protein n=1 Tax=Rhodohalobacter sp. TaxID=1974210 RepID=UPI002ACD7C3E|nr:rhodanese-like domain-containing protein [Rhodohalobacter sp.]MDZ7755133.1 rhodanese-like domain-containing protein [Rhodohalobacter sp.]